MINHTTANATEKKVTVRIEDDGVKYSHLYDLVNDAADSDRLRGARQVANIGLYLQPRSDAIIRRIFFRAEIDHERAVVKSALLHAASSLTPDRLKRMGSPGRSAVHRLQQRIARTGRHDIKVVHVSSDIRFLAKGGKKTSFLHSPAKATKSSGLLKTGAAGLVATHSEHRIQLLHFCANVEALESLARLLRQPQDHNQDMQAISCCIALFSAAVASSIAEERNIQHVDKDKIFNGVRASMRGNLPDLFVARWKTARRNGLINERSFEWVSAVDWLVNGLQPEKQTPTKRARKPKSPRSPASPSLQKLSLEPQFSPLPIRQASQGTSLQPGRQAATLRIPQSPDSPSLRILMASNGKEGHAMHAPREKRATKSHSMLSAENRHKNGTRPVIRHMEKAEKAEKAVDVVGKRDASLVTRRQLTLGEMLYLASIGKFVSQTIITADVTPVAVGEKDDPDA